MKIPHFKVSILVVAALSAAPAAAQIASHAPTAVEAGKAAHRSSPATAESVGDLRVTGKPVVRVNRTILTDRDLLREMLTIFPYARQHNGFPKKDEAKIRQGALKMIEFEELVYQEAERRKMSIPAARIDKAEAAFRGQFSSREEFEQYMKLDMKGSRVALRAAIRRSLLIDKFLKQEVDAKSAVTTAEARAYYARYPKEFAYPESFSFQSISILPPPNANEEAGKEARKRAEDAFRQGKATKTYDEFGLLAEKISEDDFHVNMGDHKVVARAKLPPEMVKAALAMKPGEVSPLLQIGGAYTFFRLNEHIQAGKVPFNQIKDSLIQTLQKDRRESLRVALDKRLRKQAVVREM